MNSANYWSKSLPLVHGQNMSCTTPFKLSRTTPDFSWPHTVQVVKNEMPGSHSFRYLLGLDIMQKTLGLTPAVHRFCSIFPTYSKFMSENLSPTTPSLFSNFFIARHSVFPKIILSQTPTNEVHFPLFCLSVSLLIFTGEIK